MLLWLVSAAATLAQGEFAFNNHSRDVGIDAPVFDTDCRSRLEGAAFSWQVYGSLSPETLQPLGEVGTFLTGEAAGYIHTWNYSVPGASVGAIIYTQLRAWAAAAGNSYDAAVASGGKHGFSNIVPITASFGSGVPSLPVGLQSFCLIPEPSVLALLAGSVAFAGGCIVRRRLRSASRTGQR